MLDFLSSLNFLSMELSLVFLGQEDESLESFIAYTLLIIQVLLFSGTFVLHFI
jgi:hypothetical protein